MAPKRKLIEVSLPLEAINVQSAREKSIRHGHPSTLHLWWARRPLATARAVLFAQLVDDPSNFVNEYRQEAIDKGYEDADGWAEHRVKQERERLFDLITRMVNWDNLGDEALFEEVHAEIMKSTNGNPPPILDPFAGGGTIPLEAQRLGLEAHASDLNPVAVLINKALIELPPRFAGHQPVFPDAAGTRNSWPGATGLAEDVRRYGEWLWKEARERIGDLYPKVAVRAGVEARAIGWIWARTVKCPNPACGLSMPLVKSWWLGKKPAKPSFVIPNIADGRVSYRISHDKSLATSQTSDGTVGRTGAVCISCQTAVDLAYIREKGQANQLGSDLIAVVIEDGKSRTYAAPDTDQVEKASVKRPPIVPPGDLPDRALGFRVQAYGMDTYSDLHTSRQLTALTVFASLVAEARDRVAKDGAEIGDRNESVEYADAVAIYLGLAVSRMTDRHSVLTTWDNGPAKEYERSVFSRHAVQMTWDFVESNPFSDAGAGFGASLSWLTNALSRLPASGSGTAEVANATTRSYDGFVISTDPPYYDNIGYSDLSDYFYVWLRLALRDIVPSLFATILVPKADELVANPFRHGGTDGARTFFEHGFEEVFSNARESASPDFPVTVYYAFKQSETDDAGVASTGWETILGGIVRSGWTVTATWPARQELANRLIGVGANALATSVVLALRPRPLDAPTTDRRGFISAMRRELAPALRELQQGGIAPVDLPQSAIGPGMGVFSRYSKVIESDGTEMSVRSALARINEVLDELLTEQEGDFDPATRFAISWYRGNGYDPGTYGDADSLARARATAVASMEREGILSARGGKVKLLRPTDLPSDYDVAADPHTSAWEALQHTIRILESLGIPAAGGFLLDASRRVDGAVDLDLVKELAYLLFQVAEKNGWTKDAISFNGVATSWSDLLDSGRSVAPSIDSSLTLDFDEDS